MTDELIARLFAAQQRLNPDADPGDLTINVQDDSPLVTATQGRKDCPPGLLGESTWFGGSVEQVLTQMVGHYESLAAVE